ncbi:MAG: PilX N-terminal domain-containing pilus assembly protein [Pseudomonadota bacterium]
MKTINHIRRQSGIALITGLIFLVVLTLLGVTAMRATSLEERMAGNMRDRNLAMESASACLRDAEADIKNSGRIDGLTATGVIGVSGPNSSAACKNGFCYNGTAGFASPVWQTFSLTASPSVEYGTYTAAGDIGGVDADPRYLIEPFKKFLPGGNLAYFYRVTCRAVGANPSTQVTLQEIFRP